LTDYKVDQFAGAEYAAHFDLVAEGGDVTEEQRNGVTVYCCTSEITCVPQFACIMCYFHADFSSLPIYKRMAGKCPDLVAAFAKFEKFLKDHERQHCQNAKDLYDEVQGIVGRATNTDEATCIVEAAADAAAQCQALIKRMEENVKKADDDLDQRSKPEFAKFREEIQDALEACRKSNGGIGNFIVNRQLELLRLERLRRKGDGQKEPFCPKTGEYYQKDR
jgi:hypothetical protein